MNELTESGLHLKIEKMDGNELVIRHGQALPLKEPKTIVIVGSIESPRLFYVARIAQISNKFAHVLVDRGKMSIILKINDRSAYMDTIEGVMQFTDELKQFKINSKSGWPIREFSDFCKMNRAYFAERSECDNLVTKTRDFKGKVETTVQKNDTNSGDRRLLIDKIVKTEIPETIDIVVPVFKGREPVKFKVELLVDTREVDYSIYLISPELNEHVQRVKNTIIDEEIKIFKDDGFAVIDV